MRTNSRTVTFNKPFRLMGLDEVQPAGSYTVETDEEQLPVLLHTGYRRTTTWLSVPSHAMKTGATQIISIDPAELEAALARDAPGGWSVSAEANIDDMLAGSVMKQAVRSAGLSLSQFKEQLRNLAHRLGRMRLEGRRSPSRRPNETRGLGQPHAAAHPCARATLEIPLAGN